MPGANNLKWLKEKDDKYFCGLECTLNSDKYVKKNNSGLCKTNNYAKPVKDQHGDIPWDDSYGIGCCASNNCSSQSNSCNKSKSGECGNNKGSGSGAKFRKYYKNPSYVKWGNVQYWNPTVSKIMKGTTGQEADSYSSVVDNPDYVQIDPDAANFLYDDGTDYVEESAKCCSGSLSDDIDKENCGDIWQGIASQNDPGLDYNGQPTSYLKPSLTCQDVMNVHCARSDKRDDQICQDWCKRVKGNLEYDCETGSMVGKVKDDNVKNLGQLDDAPELEGYSTLNIILFVIVFLVVLLGALRFVN
jgi:hypothetical protein